MKKTSISKALIVVFIFLITSSLLLLSAVPKAILLDKFLSGNGVNLIPEKVEEDLFGISFRKAKLFIGNELWAELDLIRLRLRPSGLILYALCGEGYLRGKISPTGNVSMEAGNFRCIKGIGELGGRIRLRENKIFGKVLFKELDLRSVRVDGVKLEFKGERFEGEIDYAGMKLKGGGTLKINAKKFEDTELNALFKGDLGRLLLKGKIRNLSVQLR